MPTDESAQHMGKSNCSIETNRFSEESMRLASVPDPRGALMHTWAISTGVQCFSTSRFCFEEGSLLCGI
jgi:hypothetical protein